jgi:hypothetical protein
MRCVGSARMPPVEGSLTMLPGPSLLAPLGISRLAYSPPSTREKTARPGLGRIAFDDPNHEEGTMDRNRRNGDAW